MRAILSLAFGFFWSDAFCNAKPVCTQFTDGAILAACFITASILWAVNEP